MNITLTYDHRLVDGALAGRFLTRPERKRSRPGTRSRTSGRSFSSPSRHERDRGRPGPVATSSSTSIESMQRPTDRRRGEHRRQRRHERLPRDPRQARGRSRPRKAIIGERVAGLLRPPARARRAVGLDAATCGSRTAGTSTRASWTTSSTKASIILGGPLEGDRETMHVDRGGVRAGGARPVRDRPVVDQWHAPSRAHRALDDRAGRP